jgi:hypothetical protein
MKNNKPMIPHRMRIFPELTMEMMLSFIANCGHAGAAIISAQEDMFGH